MQLSGRQKKYLRSMAHSLKPIITVGDKGITPALMTELSSSLDRHELIKVKIRSGDRHQRDAIISELAEACGAQLVGRVGNVASIYKAAQDKPQITLP